MDEERENKLFEGGEERGARGEVSMRRFLLFEGYNLGEQGGERV